MFKKITTCIVLIAFLSASLLQPLYAQQLAWEHIFAGNMRVCSIDHNGNIFYYHYDGRGNVNIITDKNGQVVQRIEYEPFGKVAFMEIRGADNLMYRFSGKPYDASTGLIYYGLRYYDPELGRWITPDPTVQHPYDPQDLNRYAYCRNNPITLDDPTGLGWWKDLWKGIGNFFKEFGGVVASVALTFVGMPFIGAIVGSALSTFPKGGSFANFATGFGIGLVSGFAGGTIAGGIANLTGMNLAGIETALLRGGLAGSIGGMGTAAIYNQDIGRGAWQGAAGGMAVGGIVWTKNNYVTNKFLKNNLRWDSSVSDTDKATFTQSLREIGQSPRGQVMLSGFMQAGKTLNIHSWSVANAQGELGGNGIWLNPDANQYNDPNSSSAWARTFNQATVMIHEMGHNLGYPDWAETQPRWALNTAYNENPYRAWIGSPRRTEYSTGIPSPRLFPDTAVWDSWDQ